MFSHNIDFIYNFFNLDLFYNIYFLTLSVSGKNYTSVILSFPSQAIQCGLLHLKYTMEYMFAPK